VRIALLLVVLVAFGALSALALAQVGYVGLFAYQLGHVAGVQVLVDLAVALTLVCAWMVVDARRTGRNPWPWVVATALFGSFGPLGYLLVGAVRDRRGAAPIAAGSR
jgi:hypothetical protein